MGRLREGPSVWRRVSAGWAVGHRGWGLRRRCSGSGRCRRGGGAGEAGARPPPSASRRAVGAAIESGSNGSDPRRSS